MSTPSGIGTDLGPGGLPSFSGFAPDADGRCPKGYDLEFDAGEAICWPDEYFRFFDKTPSPADALP